MWKKKYRCTVCFFVFSYDIIVPPSLVFSDLFVLQRFNAAWSFVDTIGARVPRGSVASVLRATETQTLKHRRYLNGARSPIASGDKKADTLCSCARKEFGSDGKVFIIHLEAATRHRWDAF